MEHSNYFVIRIVNTSMTVQVNSSSLKTRWRITKSMHVWLNYQPAKAFSQKNLHWYDQIQSYNYYYFYFFILICEVVVI